MVRFIKRLWCKHLESVHIVTSMDLMKGTVESVQTCSNCGKPLANKNFSGVELVNAEEILDTIVKHYNGTKS